MSPSETLRRLEGRRVIVTGACGGQGVAVAERLTAEGARVALTDLHRDPLEQLCARINASGGDAVWRVADLRDEAEVAAVVAATVEAFGGIDVLYTTPG